jgi:glycosyltransferase involved in cell wall biosynthesis
MQTLLYFYPVNTSFVRSDLELLSRHYRVKHFFFNTQRKTLTPFYLFYQFWFIAFYFFSAKKYVSQFSGYHSFLPSLLSGLTSRRHFIVLNGTECNNFPEYGYGYLSKPLLNWFSKTSLARATKLLPVSESLVYSDYTYKETLFQNQGYKAFYPEISTPYEVIYNGISPKKFVLRTNHVRDTTKFLTVATGLNSSRIKGIKGLDMIIELAEKTPQYQYTFIGAEVDANYPLPSNIRVVGFVNHDELGDYYNAHAFYLQLSVSEGFGIAVCEAMLCGCVPIVSNVGMLPSIAGNVGYVLETKNIQKLYGLVEKARKEYSIDRLPYIREHITNHFDIAIRESKLQALIG